MFESITNTVMFASSLLGTLAAAYLIPLVRQKAARRKMHTGSEKSQAVETRGIMERISYLSVQIALILVLLSSLGSLIFEKFFR